MCSCETYQKRRITSSVRVNTDPICNSARDPIRSTALLVCAAPTRLEAVTSFFPRCATIVAAPAALNKQQRRQSKAKVPGNSKLMS
ncbi:hypothetical protein L195_g040988 [Trifolium pratense]|uniref:Uncharacterized protein n=1 Tax=Trifolium pratense TaxID=57577 RepID=A0A2K3M2F6_TRIPR|nr:hypothetical protein L195_g029205 [Trifolium pratense]PNX73883.1 hypothetical protein L195_g029792 [Trifolium pratense]PNX84923.1 hypothetical protein L195_g040988 [Trifolium pratense]